MAPGVGGEGKEGGGGGGGVARAMEPRRPWDRENHDDENEMVDALVGAKGGGDADVRRQSRDSGSARGPLELGVLVSGTSSGAGDVDASVDMMPMENARDLYRGKVGNLRRVRTGSSSEISITDGRREADAGTRAIEIQPPMPPMPYMESAYAQMAYGAPQHYMPNMDVIAATMTQGAPHLMHFPAIWTNDDPSRTLYLTLSDPMMSDHAIWTSLQVFGDIRTLSTEMRRSLNAVFVSFFDVRCAENAKRTLQTTSNVFSSVAYSGTCDWIPGMENQGRFLILDIGSTDDAELEVELRAHLEQFGELKLLSAPRGHGNHRFVEYYDVRHAEFAVIELQSGGFRGKPCHIDFSWATPHMPMQLSPPSPPSMQQFMMPSMYWPYGAGMPAAQLGSESMAGYEYHPNWSTDQYGFSTQNKGYSNQRSPRTSGEFQRSPRTSENMPRSRSSQNSTVNDSSRALNPEEFIFNMEEAEADEGAAAPSEHGRTTLMIRNIPNKYNQAMMLDLLNRSYAGQYDFFYLPIDFKNKCNLGYAFVNFKCTKTTADFYKEFHRQRWEEFNSRKVCEVTYARVQGKEAMIEHFKNSRFPCENEEYLPLVFDTHGNKTLCHTLGHAAPRALQHYRD